jgi:outer membrane receptor for ferrienterochelin and colicins
MRGVIFVGLMLMAVIVNGQTISVKGEVIDLRSEERIKHATVQNVNRQQSVLTDHRGEFTLMVAVGDTITITAVGYLSDTVAVSASTRMISVQLQPATKSLEEVVISGTLREIRKSNSPIAVESYSAKFFKKNASATVFEALSIVNGVQPQLNCNVCNTGDIHINGMEGPYTMVLIDGMPVVSNLATVYGFSGIPANLIKRIEIVKGPSSTLYGSESVAGLINIITKDPGSAALFHADVYATSYDEVNADISAKFKLGKAHSLLGVNMFNFSKRYDVNQDNFTDVTLQKRISLFNKWSFDRKNKLPFQFAVRLLTEDRWGGEMQWNKTWRGTDSIYGESIYTKRMELIGNYGIKVGSEQLLLEYSYNFHHQDSYYGTIPYMAKQHSAFAQLRWNKDIGKHSISAGLPYRFIWYDDNTVATAKPDGLTTQPSVQKLQGLFVQDELKFNDRWTMLAGVRYELTNVQGGIVSPRLALKWNNGHHQVFRFSAGNGFRIVNLFTEDHAALSGAREVVIAESLDPERSWNGNVNYTGTFIPSFGFITLDATLFYTYFTNKIIPDYDTDPQKIIYQNIDGYAVSRGFTLNTDFSFKNRLKIIAGITLMDVFTKEKNQNGIAVKQQQILAPKFSGNYAVSYSFPRWKLAVDLTGKVFGPQRLPVVPNDFRPEYSPWFTLANLQLTQRIGKKVELYGGIKNLLNFMPENPILRPEDPFDKRVNDVVNNPNGYTFDPSYNYAPLSGRRAFLGVRVNID